MEYYRDGSNKNLLHLVRRPLICIQAEDDPFAPSRSMCNMQATNWNVINVLQRLICNNDVIVQYILYCIVQNFGGRKFGRVLPNNTENIGELGTANQLGRNYWQIG